VQQVQQDVDERPAGLLFRDELSQVAFLHDPPFLIAVGQRLVGVTFLGLAIGLEVRLFAVFANDNLGGSGRQRPGVGADVKDAFLSALSRLELDLLSFLDNPKFLEVRLILGATVLGQRSITLGVVVIEDGPQGDENGESGAGGWRPPGDVVQGRRRLVEVPLQEQRPGRQHPRHNNPQQQEDQDQLEHETPQLFELRFSIVDFTTPPARRRESKIENHNAGRSCGARGRCYNPAPAARPVRGPRRYRVLFDPARGSW
jgi:hypothetical protein